MEIKASLEAKGEADFHVCTLKKAVTIKKNMVSISIEKQKEHQRAFTPSVIEPSFGIGRIIYCVYEHSFYTRPSKDGEEQVNVFRFSPLIAPIKCTVFPLVQNLQYEEVAMQIAKLLKALGISYKIDVTGTHLCYIIDDTCRVKEIRFKRRLFSRKRKSKFKLKDYLYLDLCGKLILFQIKRPLACLFELYLFLEK